MKNLKKVLLGIFFAGTMLYSSPAEARWHSGSYVDGDGCRHVVEYYRFLGIVWTTRDTVFCPDHTITNPDGSTDTW